MFLGTIDDTHASTDTTTHATTTTTTTKMNRISTSAILPDTHNANTSTNTNTGVNTNTTNHTCNTNKPNTISYYEAEYGYD